MLLLGYESVLQWLLSLSTEEVEELRRPVRRRGRPLLDVMIHVMAWAPADEHLMRNKHLRSKVQETRERT